MTRKIGIIGANWSLKVHGSAWRMLPGVELAAVCTAHRETAEAAAEAYGVPRAYWDFREMAADPDLDIIDVGSRPAYRFDMVMAALAGGKHVYNSLPFAMNTARAVEQRDKAAEKGLVGVVDAQFRWVPAAMHMKSLIDEGFLGEPLGFNAQLLSSLINNAGYIYPHASYAGAGVAPYKWLAEASSGGSGWRNYGTHTMLLLMHLIGKARAATGTDTTGVKEWRHPDGDVLQPDTADLGCAVLRMENGAIGTIQTGWAVPDAPRIRIEIWGARGRLLYVDPTMGDGISARLYAGDASKLGLGNTMGEWLDTPEEFYRIPGTGFSKANLPAYMVSMGWMFHDMLAAIKDRRAASPSFAEAVHAHKVVEAVIESGRSGRWIDIDDR